MQGASTQMGADGVQVRLDGVTVAEYVTAPDVDARLSPRPYLHPVRTLRGVPVTEILPADHPHHLGASVAVQDVDKTNLWGGRTYVRDTGYTWLDDHGRIDHEGFAERSEDGFVAHARWRDRDGTALLAERLGLRVARSASEADAWILQVDYTLTSVGRQTVTLGSPATNGRPGGSGYGGFFWRAPMADRPPAVYAACAEGEDAVNGSTEPWVAMSGRDYTLVFAGLGDGDRWFVRAAGYPGVCAAVAFERTLAITPEQPLTRRHAVLIADGSLSRTAAAKLIRGRVGAIPDDFGTPVT